MATYYDQIKLTYQQLVMQQIKIIQNICSKELRDGTKIVKNLIGEQTIEGEDTRYSFLQSVDVLGSLLHPYMKDKGTEAEAYKSFCELYDIELIKALEDKEFKKELQSYFMEESDVSDKIKKDEALRNQANLFLLNYKIKDAREVFRILLKLFKDNDFLAGESYGDGAGTGNEGMDAEDTEEGDEAVEE